MYISFTVSSLCANLESTFYRHMRPHHTGDISNLLFMSHLSQSTHNSALAWMDEASAYLNWYPVFLCSQKQWVVLLQASLSAVLVSHCQHVPQKSKLKICVKFSPVA